MIDTVPMRAGWRFFTKAIAVVCAAGCGDSADNGPTNPASISGNLRVSVTNTLDTWAKLFQDQGNGFQVRAGTTRASVAVNGVVTLLLAPGVHDVQLEALPDNCSVAGPDVVPVTAVPSLVNQVQFRVECRAVTGVIEIRAQASGRDYDADGFTVVVDDGQPQENSATAYLNAVVWLEGVAPGSHQMSVAGLTDNCVPSQSGSFPVSVTAGGLTRDTSHVVVEVVCAATTGDVRIITTTAGTHYDPNGYTLEFDGALLAYTDFYYYYAYPVRLEPNGRFDHTQVTPGTHAYTLTDLDPNCTVGDNPKTVTVVLGEVTDLPFHVVCSDIP